ncbi:MAG TPA: CPBP family intramembrane glutamic endopeptidase [Flavobacteriales bacterium]|jgi:membrane protease YdiL (CAAX protease family)|nr:CPBP family intramembrane glutamic endopeptidase [Flavobacteriales bacterium]
MEPSYEPEKRSPEPAYIRPPGLEFGRGLAIFSLVFLVFFGAQIVLFIERVIHLTPELRQQGFSFSLLDSAHFQERYLELSSNGDVLALVSLFSGLIGLALLFATVASWKKGRTVQFLAMRLPDWKAALAWTGLFLVVFVVLEVVAYFLPEMDSDFMKKVLATVTNYPLLVLGVCVLPALFEEFLLRGLLYGSLRHLLDKHTSIAIVAGLFALVHQQYEWYIQLLYVLPLGVFLGYARANTGSIWTGIFLHMLNNCLSIVLPQIFQP